MKNVLRFMRPVAWGIVGAASLKSMATFVDLLIPTALGVLIDEGVSKGDVAMIYRMLLAMLACTVLSGLLHTIAHYYSAKYSQSMSAHVREAAFAKIETLSPRALEGFERTSLITRVTNDTENIQQAINMCIRPLMRGLVLIVGGIAFSLMTDVGLTIPIFFGMVFVSAASSVVYKVTRPLFRKVQRAVDALSCILRENIEGIRFIKALDKSAYELARFCMPVTRVKQSEQKAGVCQGVIQPGIQFLSNAVLILVVFVGQARMATGDISVGDIFTVTGYVSMILMASNMMPRVIMMLSRANISADRVAAVLDCDDVMQYGTQGIAPPSPDGAVPEIAFENVWFTYPHAKTPSLCDVSFRLYKGETLGVTGDTGAGKSTLIALALRMYDPQKGEIYFRGKSLRSYSKESLRAQITAALQQFDMFAGGIEENICLERPLEAEAFARAVQTAQLSTLFETQEGRTREVTQRGTNLSGGQKQRVSVARALYRDAALLMLDDVSGGLDYYTDKQLRAAIAQNYAGQTVLIASQRVSSVAQATKLLVLEAGRVCGYGTRSALEETCAKYQEMCRIQRAGSEVL